MINLIPNEEKKKKVKDFYFRLLVVFFMVLGFSITISSVAILPAYFISWEKKNLVNNKLEMQKGEPVLELDQKTLTLAGDLNKKLSLVEKIKTDKYFISQKIISEIILGKMSGIKITGIRYQTDPVKGKIVGLNGTAPSRERLLLFRKALEENAAFKKVDLPISNFIKGSNIQFYLSLVPVS